MAATADVWKSLIKRAGSKFDGLGYRAEFCWIVLVFCMLVYRVSESFDPEQESKSVTYQTFVKMVAAFGMRYPSYSSSLVFACGKPKTAVGNHRNVSLTQARMYGIDFPSSRVGSLSPQMRSISSCAVLCTSGNSTIARTKPRSCATEVSVPPSSRTPLM